MSRPTADSREDELSDFRALVRGFVDRDVLPYHAEWEAQGIVPRELWRTAGEAGLLGLELPEEFGGAGIRDFRFNAIVVEELSRAGASGPGVGFSVHNDVCAPYFANLADREQSARWVPGLASGDSIAAIAMTEPGTGSDLQAIRTTARPADGGWIVNGAKMFITNGINADLVITAVRTDPAVGTGLSLVVIERGMAGFERGAALKKIGLRAQDTAELSFTDVFVPRENLLGEEGLAFQYMMHTLVQERLAIAVQAVAATEGVLEETLAYGASREAFGQPIGTFQHNAFALAECATDVKAARVFLDWAVAEHVVGRLSPDTAAMVKLHTTEMQQKVIARCLQLHGGYGFMEEYAVARAWTDARVQTIYGGTSELMKLIVSRSLGLRPPRRG
ncbi:acyl-CoA dehydrogenase family protein [Microbacterium aurum]